YHFTNAKNSSVNLCRPRDLPLLASIDIGYHGQKFSRPPSLHLDEAQGLAVKSDNVDLARYLHAFAVSANRYLEIRANQTISVFDQKLRSKCFSAFADCRHAWSRNHIDRKNL